MRAPSLSTPEAARARATPVVAADPAAAVPSMAAPVAAAGHRYVVAAIGDSITDTRVGGGKYLAHLARRCPTSRFDAYGIGGQQTVHMRWRFLDDLFGRPKARTPKPAYKHVIVLGGVNDLRYGASAASIESELAVMYQTARARGLSVIALTVPIWLPHSDVEAANNDALNAWILDQERLGNVDHAVDIRPVLMCPSEKAICVRYRRYPVDTVHWNDLGHAAVAAAIKAKAFADCE